MSAPNTFCSGLLREQEGVAAQVLMNLGLKLEDVREEVLNLLGHGLGHDARHRVGIVVEDREHGAQQRQPPHAEASR